MRFLVVFVTTVGGLSLPDLGPADRAGEAGAAPGQHSEPSEHNEVADPVPPPPVALLPEKVICCRWGFHASSG